MVIKRVKPTIFQITIHTYELAALVAAARMAVEDRKESPENLDQDARLHLESILADYDQALKRIQD